MSSTETSSGLGQKRPVAGGVEHAGHAQHPLAGEAAGLHRDVAHHVEGIGDDHDDGLRRDPGDLLRHRAHDAGVGLDQVVPAHPRLPGDPGRNDEHVRASGLVVAVAADDPGVEALDGSRLPLVEPLALRHAVHDVHHDHGPGEIFFGQPLRRSRSDVSRPDHRNFSQHAGALDDSGVNECIGVKPPQYNVSRESGVVTREAQSDALLPTPDS